MLLSPCVLGPMNLSTEKKCRQRPGERTCGHGWRRRGCDRVPPLPPSKAGTQPRSECPPPLLRRQRAAGWDRYGDADGEGSARLRPPLPFTSSLWKNSSFVQNECVHLAGDYAVCLSLISKVKGLDPFPQPRFQPQGLSSQVPAAHLCLVSSPIAAWALTLGAL